MEDISVAIILNVCGGPFKENRLHGSLNCMKPSFFKTLYNISGFSNMAGLFVSMLINLYKTFILAFLYYPGWSIVAMYMMLADIEHKILVNKIQLNIYVVAQHSESNKAEFWMHMLPLLYYKLKLNDHICQKKAHKTT